MPSVREIRRRIRSVENTAKITKAMSMIAASRMRRTQEAALKGRPFSDRISELLSNLAAQPQDEEYAHPLLDKRPVEKIGVVHITPDRGLTGGLHATLNRAAGQFILDQSAKVSAIPVGKKGRDFMVRSGIEVRGVFSDIPDRPSLDDILPISRLGIDDYTSKRFDAVYVIFARFVNTTVQRPEIMQLLPAAPAELDPSRIVGYIYEPNSSSVLTDLLPRSVEMQLYHAILESIASEQSARMVAMRNATDNANEMVEDLTLVMNKARQEMITTELLDIVAGVAAVES